MRTRMLARSALLAALGPLALVPPPAALASPRADQDLVWSYDDPVRDGRRIVDVIRTQLDRKVEGHYRIRVYGRDFVKNETDIVRIYFDTDADEWPEYSLSWYMGRNPARPVHRTSLYVIDYWNDGNRTKVRCPHMGHQVNYARNSITVLVARACLENPVRLRWAGFVASIYGLNKTKTRFYSHQDQFPAYREFPEVWAG